MSDMKENNTPTTTWEKNNILKLRPVTGVLNIDSESDNPRVKCVTELIEQLQRLLPGAIIVSDYSDELPDKLPDDIASYIVNQTAVDIICKNYINSEPPLNVNEYSDNLCAFLYGYYYSNYSKDYTDEVAFRRSVYDRVTRFAKKHIATEEKRDTWNQKFIGPINNCKENHKLIWDYCYINGNRSLLTAKQYNRKLNKKMGNNTNTEITQSLNEYNKLINEWMHFDDKATSKDKFDRTIRYYFIESYKRIDLFLALSSELYKLSTKKVSMKHFFDKRLLELTQELQHPDVSKFLSILTLDLCSSHPIDKFSPFAKIRLSFPDVNSVRYFATKMIQARMELLELYSQSFIEKYLNNLSEYLSENDKIPGSFITTFIEDFYGNKKYVIERKVLFHLLVEVTQNFIYFGFSIELLCLLYEYMFTEYVDILDEFYISQFKTYQRIRSSLITSFESMAVYDCSNSDELSNFLMNDYKVFQMHKVNDRLWEIISNADAKVKASANSDNPAKSTKRYLPYELINTIKEFLKLSEFFHC